MRNVLFIAKNFPPLYGIGSLRTAGFVRLLPEFGWHPIIITIDEKSIPKSLLDKSLNRFLPSCFEKISVRDHALEFESLIRKKSHVLMKKSKQHDENKITTLVRDRKGKKGGAILRFFGLPDIYMCWAIAACAKGLTKAKKCHVIYCCGLPIGCHLTGIFLAKIYKKPLVCDFRDPYIWPGVRKFPTPLHERIGAIIEKIIIKNSTTIITIGNKFKEEFVKRYPDQKNKIYAIMNGYDGELIKLSNNNNPIMTLVHAGNIFNDEALEVLINALETLSKIGLNFIFKMVGRLDLEQLKIIKLSSVADSIQIIGQVSQKENFKHIQSADILFLESCGNISKIAIRAKLFEYIRAQKKILAIVR